MSITIYFPKDWTEDFDKENGNYQCKCLDCGELFIGHKRRIQCKVCAERLGRVNTKLFTLDPDSYKQGILDERKRIIEEIDKRIIIDIHSHNEPKDAMIYIDDDFRKAIKGEEDL
jgi:hypothetical protein